MAGLSDKQEADARKAANIRWAKARRDFAGVWVSIPGLPGYFASESGEVRSQHTILAATKQKSGHLIVCPSVGGKQRPEAVHRLVCIAFHGPCPAGMECRHKDGDPANNKPGNLQWGTRLENQRDCLEHGTTNVGARNGRAKLSHEDMLALGQRARAKEDPKALAAEYAVSVSYVRNIASGARGKFLTQP